MAVSGRRFDGLHSFCAKGLKSDWQRSIRDWRIACEAHEPLTGTVELPEAKDSPRYLFVTGRLAECALRQVLLELAPRAGFRADVAVLPISVAALMTPQWVARHLDVPAGVEKVILPGMCQGDLTPVFDRARGVAVESGPEDLRDLPRHFGQVRRSPAAMEPTTSKSSPRSIMPRGSKSTNCFARPGDFMTKGLTSSIWVVIRAQPGLGWIVR